VGAIPIGRAVEVIRQANDVLAQEVRKHPDRFAGFAALPMQDPELAASELERCVRDLGFWGALVHGFSQVGSVAYYDAHRPVTDDLRENFYVTTSGHLSTTALLPVLSEMGADRIMFSSDYPFEDLSEAARWFDNASIDQNRPRTNANKLLEL
jgi:predicted TIM-barrel fold metal-dependent hydrolase